MDVKNEFPMIAEVCMEIAYDNDALSCGRTEDQYMEAVAEVLGADGVYHEDLERLEEWLASLTPAKRLTVGVGEYNDMEALCAKAPRGGPDNQPLTNLFNDVFEHC